MKTPREMINDIYANKMTFTEYRDWYMESKKKYTPVEREAVKQTVYGKLHARHIEKGLMYEKALKNANEEEKHKILKMKKVNDKILEVFEC